MVPIAKAFILKIEGAPIHITDCDGLGVSLLLLCNVLCVLDSLTVCMCVSVS